MKKKIIISIILGSTLLCVGCQNKTNISVLQKQCAKDISKIQNTISKTYIPTNDILLIPAFEYNSENIESESKALSSWNIIFSKPISQQAITDYPKVEFPFQYTNIIATYTPRYVSTSNGEISGFNKFINKLENLYLQMQDSLYANNEIMQIKNNFNFQLSLIKEKINTMQNRNEEISSDQLKNAQEILNELVNMGNKLKDCDNETKEICEDISNEKNNLLLNTETLSNKYIKLVNCFDNKLSYLNNIQQCLNQLDLIVIGESLNNNQPTNHYIHTEHLKPISRDEYLNKYKDKFKTELSFNKPAKKIPLPYIVDSTNNNNNKQYV